MSQLRSDPRVAPIFRVGPAEREDINIQSNFIIVHDKNENMIKRVPT